MPNKIEYPATCKVSSVTRYVSVNNTRLDQIRKKIKNMRFYTMCESFVRRQCRKS